MYEKQLPKNVPEELSELLGKLASNLPALLGDNLVGVYLWGSLTYDGFDESCSDADGIVVTRTYLVESEFSKLDAWFAGQLAENPWTAKLDLRFFIDGEFLDKTSRCMGYHFGKLTRHGSDANPFFWINVAKSGITLWGKPAKDIAPHVSAELLNEALLLEVDYLKETLPRYVGDKSDEAFFYTAYAVLTACRILYTANTGTLVSKNVAAKFAQEHLPKRWHSLIETAMNNRLKGKVHKSAILERETANFVEFIESCLFDLFKEGRGMAPS